MNRRRFLSLPAAALAVDAAVVDYAPAIAGRPLVFPRDHGSHPEFRTEWWYITAAVGESGARSTGVQITFFRNRPGVAETSASAFAPRQLLFAHGAIADAGYGRLRHEQRASRAGFSLGDAATETTHVWIDDWSLQLAGDVYTARIAAHDFALALQFSATQAVLLQGESGFSRKGPERVQASYYYSRPQLRVSGSLDVDGKRRLVEGVAWLDHEWSSEYLAPNASGWDWTGINFGDGGALMAFQIRNRSGGALWAGGALRTADGRVRRFEREEIALTPTRRWRSPRTEVEYPVAMTLRADGDEWQIEPVMDDQELDSRATTGTIYWEGLVRVSMRGREVGRGYLELTGYWRRLKL